MGEYVKGLESTAGAAGSARDDAENGEVENGEVEDRDLTHTVDEDGDEEEEQGEEEEGCDSEGHDFLSEEAQRGIKAVLQRLEASKTQNSLARQRLQEATKEYESSKVDVSRI